MLRDRHHGRWRGRPGARLADVGAQVLADPHTHVGPSTAAVVDGAVQPVVADPEPQLPVTVTDAQGTEVTVTDASRILALDIYGTTARTVAELGLGDNLVGRDTSSTFPEVADLPLVTGNGHELNAESILALDPTVIITDSSLGPWDVVLQMRESGIPVVVLDSGRSLETTGDLVRDVADALGVSEAGELLAERTDAEVAAITAEIAAIAPTGEDRLKIAFLYVRGGSGIYYLFGGESGTGAIIDALGARDIATEIGWTGMKPVTDEGLISMQPDLLLVMTKGLESAGGVDGLLESVPAIAQTPAGQNRRIVDMADSQVLSFGPMTADVLEALAVAVYAPDAAAGAQDEAADGGAADGGAVDGDGAAAS
ncbi:heme/hemin ABC transporter substrate-binding protein [Serinibacter arcticus]|uniref:heme/hemin ABC transporter substrate-binding protein n=1 Tax=Serinibacter arcticus TaxID=1655435 RepID=UPI001F2516C9|nr:ABC transporter substrate-binding protein [Serinibacter arcticus]